MSIPTVTVTARVYDQSGNPAEGSIVTMRLSTTERFQGYIVPNEVSAIADVNGIATLNVFPNELGTEGSEYRVTIKVVTRGHVSTSNCPGSILKTVSGYAVVPNSDCDLQDIMELPTSELRGTGQVIPSEVAGYATQASGYRDAAQSYADAANVSKQSAESASSAAIAAKDAAIAAQNAASGHADRADTAADSAVQTAINFENTVVSRVNNSVNELVADATLTITNSKTSSLNEINSLTAASKQEIVDAIAGAKSTATTDIANLGQTWLDNIESKGNEKITELKDEGDLYLEDMNNIMTDTKSLHDKVLCSASAAANSAKEACQCAESAKASADIVETEANKVYELVPKAIQAYENILIEKDIIKTTIKDGVATIEAEQADALEAIKDVKDEVITAKDDAIQEITDESKDIVQGIEASKVVAMSDIIAEGDKQEERLRLEADGVIDEATAQADRAQAEADRAKSEADRAKSIAGMELASGTNIGLCPKIGDGLILTGDVLSVNQQALLSVPDLAFPDTVAIGYAYQLTMSADSSLINTTVDSFQVFVNELPQVIVDADENGQATYNVNVVGNDFDKGRIIVVATDSNGNESRQSEVEYTARIAEVIAPTIVSPFAGEMDVLLDAPIIINEFATSGIDDTADKMQVQISLSADFSTILWDSGIIDYSTSIAHQPYQEDSVLYIRAKAKGIKFDWSDWSNVRSFNSIAQMVLSPFVEAPLDGAVDVHVYTDIEVSGLVAQGTTASPQNTRIQLSKDADFSSLFFEYDDVYTRSVSSDFLTPSTKFYVRAQHEDSVLGWTNWSNTVSFSTVNVSILAPTFVSPTDGASDIMLNVPIVIEPMEVVGDTDTPKNLTVRVAKDAAFTDVIFEDVVSNPSISGNTTVTPTGQEPDTPYWIKAVWEGNTYGESASSVVNVRTIAAYVEDPVIVTPAAGSEVRFNQCIVRLSDFTTVPEGIATHTSTDWKLISADGTVLHESISDTENKLNYNFSEYLSESDIGNVTVQVKFNSSVGSSVTVERDFVLIEADFIQFVAEGSVIAMPLNSYGKSITKDYGFTIDWGDGTVEDHVATNSNLSTAKTHTYSDNGEHTITIYQQAGYNNSDWLLPLMWYQRTPETLKRIISMPSDMWALGGDKVTGSVSHNFLQSTLQGCTSLTSFTLDLPQSLTSVGDSFLQSTLYGCTSLTSFTLNLPQSLTSVDANFLQSTLQGCTSLASFTLNLPQSLTSVSSYFLGSMLNGCSSLTSFTLDLPQSLTSVSYSFLDSTLRGCTSLTSFTLNLPQSLTSIGYNFLTFMLRSCTSLASFTLNLSQTNITSVSTGFLSNMLQSCTSLTSFTLNLPQNITSVDYHFLSNMLQGCTLLTLLTLDLPQNLTSVGDYFLDSTLQGCTSLVSVGSMTAPLGTAGHLPSRNCESYNYQNTFVGTQVPVGSGGFPACAWEA